MKNKHILGKTYNPKPVEEKWNRFWEDEGLFVAQAASPKKKFSMVLPPPNVTGRLHIGHALCFTLPDIIVRWRRMQGYNTLWLPGTDHASIAVHNVVEQSLEEKGLSGEQIGREKFLEVAWEWKEKHGNIIISQLKKLGASLDWTRERFTLDEGYAKAVRSVFVDLYNEGLIYRDYYLVNRCPHCGTVLSDIEVEHQQRKGKLYYLKYPLEGSEDFVVVATTRPETMLGDTGVAVHPEDERYSKLQGKKVNLPLTNRVIPIILDGVVDKEFGTGAVKVTPAHDPVDYELGKKHNLEQIIVIDGSGRMTEDAGEEFKGLDRFECREKVLEKLKKAGLLEKVEDYQHAVGHCYRCKTIIEPNLSWQWFVKVEPLAKEAIKVVEEEDIQFIPPNWAKTYFEWMYNIHDWCISRQLWWGHRIPAWYCQDCTEMMVALEAPQECRKCKSSRLVQEEDVLDTWFSSALWPFATMGWPEETEDLKVFYPTDLMSTGFDIIFFWVARMIMMGLKFARGIPFRHVFINGLVRDFKRRKMSKSEGNVIDPLDMIEKYGTDALRFTLAALAIPGMDLSLSEERMAGYRAFANKIWNASRFVLMNIGEGDFEIKAQELTLADRWIRSRTDRIIQELNEALEEYKFYEAADKIYHFVWHEFCDWYIELVKPALKEKNKTSQAVLVESLDLILKLLHPFMPFISEEIWQHLPLSQKSLAVAPFPESNKLLRDEEAETEMALLQKAIVEVRTIRAENRIPPRAKVELWMKVKDEEEKSMIETHQIYFQTLANVRNIEFVDQFPPEKKLLKGVIGSWEVAVSLEGVLDLEQEKKRLEREISKLLLDTKKLENRLKNKNFIDRAPENVVQETKEKLKSLQNRKAKFEESLRNIS
jgi:valyl-tRNA synthetase